MKKLIVSGCSITHGAETVNGFMHPDNITNSFSYHMAQHLGLELVNVALSGGSNDDVFHSLVEQINKTPADEIHSVVAAWTSLSRIHWVNNGRHWFFIPGWACSTDNLYEWEFHHYSDNDLFVTADSDEMVELLRTQHRFFIDNYLDDVRYLYKRTANFKTALQAICDNKNIRLVHLDIFDYWKERRHPDIQEHQALAQQFLQKFY